MLTQRSTKDLMQSLTLAIGLMFAGAASADTVIVRSGPKTSGPGTQFSKEYVLEARAPKGQKIVSHTLQLVGDRTACGAWSTCRVLVATDDVVAVAFALQGHNEGGALYLGNPNEGRRDSEAILTILTK